MRYLYEYQDGLFALLAERIPITGGWLRSADGEIEQSWGIIETIDIPWTPPAGWRGETGVT